MSCRKIELDVFLIVRLCWGTDVEKGVHVPIVECGMDIWCLIWCSMRIGDIELWAEDTVGFVS